MFPLFFHVGSRRVPGPIEAFLNRPKTPDEGINLQERKRERGKRGESRLEWKKGRFNQIKLADRAASWNVAIVAG